MPIPQNYDYDSQNADLLRRQQLADAMMSGALHPNNTLIQPAGGGRASILAGLVPIAQALMSKKMQSSVAADRADLTDRYKQDLASGLQDFMNTTSGGTKSIPMPGPPAPDGTGPGNLTVTQAPDQRKAILDALASNHPIVQQLGMAGVQKMMSGGPFQQYLQSLQQQGQQGGQPQAAAPQPELSSTPQASMPGQPAPAAAPPLRPIEVNYGDTPQAPAGGGDPLAQVAPHVPANMRMGLYAQDPTGKALMDAEVKFATPVVGRGDGLFVSDGKGGMVLAPHYTEGMQQVEQVKAGVKNANELVEGQLPDGTPIRQTRAQALQAAGGGMGLPGQAPQQGNGMGLPGGGTVNGRNPGVAKEQDEYHQNLAKVHTQLIEDGSTAASVEARVRDMAESSQNFTSGSLQPYKGALGGMLIALGQDPAKVDAKLGSVSDWQAFNKEATQLAFDMTRKLGSREAASVVQMAVKSSANDSLQPTANRRILGVILGLSQYQQAKARSADAWVRARGTLDGFETTFNKEIPIQDYIKSATAELPMPKQPPAAQPAQQPKIIRFEDLP